MAGWFSLFKILWKFTEKSDNKRHAKQTLPQGIKEENGFYYLNDKNVYHQLDVYYPEQNNGNLPVIIDVHGGGWMYGDKELNKIYCEYVASRGFLVFNISYRLAPEVRVKQQLQDVSAALLWIKENLNRFPADASKIMLTGDSAGGQLAAYTGVLSCSQKAREIFNTVDFGLNFSCITLTSPVAYMNQPGIIGSYTKIMWGEKPFGKCNEKYMNIDEIIDFAPDYPPTLLITSSGDFLALEQTRLLYQLFNSKGIKAELFDLPKYEGKDLPHVYAVIIPVNKPGKECIDRMARFFRQYI